MSVLSLPLIQVGQLSVTGERTYTLYWLTALEACPGTVWQGLVLGEILRDLLNFWPEFSTLKSPKGEEKSHAKLKPVSSAREVSRSLEILDIFIKER